jgi:hypothetical protein
MNLHLVAALMNEFVRAENNAYMELLRRADRRLRNVQRSMMVLESAMDEARTDNTLLRRILHEIFLDFPDIRRAYAEIVFFEDLESDNDSVVDMANDVARELDFENL